MRSVSLCFCALKPVPVLFTYHRTWSSSESHGTRWTSHSNLRKQTERNHSCQEKDASQHTNSVSTQFHNALANSPSHWFIDYCDEIMFRALYFTSCIIHNWIFFGAVPLWQFGVQAACTHPSLLENSLCLSFLSGDCRALLTISTKAELQVSKQEKDSAFTKLKLCLLFAVTV